MSSVQHIVDHIEKKGKTISKFQLPAELRKALEIYETICLATEINYEAAVIVKLPGKDIAGFREAPVRYQYELAQYEQSPVICLSMDILDDPRRPYAMETFLNVASEHDLALARKLSKQKNLTLHFLDERVEYQFSKQIKHRHQQRRELAGMIRMALAHLETLSKVDWYAARQRFMREVQR